MAALKILLVVFLSTLVAADGIDDKMKDLAHDISYSLKSIRYACLSLITNNGTRGALR